MSIEITFTEPEGLISKTDIMSEVRCTHSDGAAWGGNYGDLLLEHANAYLSLEGKPGIFRRDEFDDAIKDLWAGLSAKQAFSMALKAKTVRSTFHRDMLTTVVLPAASGDEDRMKWFAFDHDGAVVLLMDDTAAKAWLEEATDRDRFVRFIDSGKTGQARSK